MNAIPDEILIEILSVICSTDIDVRSNKLLDHIANKKWQVLFFRQYRDICLVCSNWDELMCHKVRIPFYPVKIKFRTRLYTRYHHVECIFPILFCSDNCSRLNTIENIYPSRLSSVAYLGSHTTLSRHTNFIVWKSGLKECPNIMEEIRKGQIETIGLRTFGDLFSDYEKHWTYRKWNIRDRETVIKLKYIAYKMQYLYLVVYLNRTHQIRRELSEESEYKLNQRKLSDILRDEIQWY